MNLRNTLVLALISSTTALTSPSLHAGPVTSKAPVISNPPPSESGWWFRAAPYVWLTAVEGDVSVGRLSSSVDVSMKDTLDSLDMGYMGVFEAGHGRWSVGMDVVYGKVSDDFAAGGRLFRSFRYEQKQWLLTPFAAYRAVDAENVQLDIFAGARITILEAELTGRFARGGEITGSKDTDFADPIVGLRGQVGLTEKLFLRFNGDIGGFGASSDLTWQAFAGLGLRVSDSVSLAAGYRGLGVDYEKDSFAMDTVSHGPVVGLEVRW
ncbi:hypothetical protein [Roseimicrobium sp. ORNL1]|uniref:hypothetical protein n=1 Tax=Roseimicrobium sp. ORNL1 TaxID=2711231 RepID=UPI0013E166C6|nr:hypothetical protein [Roseimicrobium sp. ORNL1]QIF04356.1 hypothetical protein G5S37_23460 [Roseimicrobium sp. ORNL1]